MPAWAPPEAEEKQSWQPPEAESWAPPEAVDHSAKPPAPPSELVKSGLEQLRQTPEGAPGYSESLVRPDVQAALDYLRPPPAEPAGSLIGHLEHIPQQQGPVRQILGGVSNTISDVAESLTSPQNLALLPLSAVRGVGRLAGLLFGAQALSDVPEAARETIAPNKTLQERIQSGGRTLTDVLFGVTGAGYGVGADVIIPKIVERSRSAAAEISKEAETAVPKPAEEVKPNAEQITQTAQPDGLRTEPAVPPKTEEPAVAQSSEGIPPGGQGPQVQEVAPPAVGEPIEQAPMAEVRAPEPIPPAEAVPPKLRPGEKQGDLLSTQPEDLALVGEKGTDFAARQAETDAAAQRAEEAQLKAEHEQGLLSDFQEHQARGGDELLNAIESGGGIPAKSSPHADTLSGELKNIREELVSETGQQKTRGFDYNKIFKKDASDLDTLTRHLREKGFDVETPNDTLSLIQDRLRSGKPIYGSEARTAALEEASFGREYGFGIKSAPFADSLGGRSAIDTWADRVKSLRDVASSVKRFIENAPQRDEVAAKFDAANNKAGYVARQARNHVELAGRETELPSSEIAQKAATFVRQAFSDPMRDLFAEKDPKGAMLAKLNAIKGKGYDDVIAYVGRHWDSLEKIANAAKSATDAAFQEAKAAGVTVDYRDNYVKGAYHDPVTQKVVFDETGGGRGTATSFKKGKVFNDYAEAIAAGFKPRELRLDLLTESAVNSMLRAVNRKAWADSIGEIKMPDGQPAVAPPTENGSAPRGYKPVQVTSGNLVNIHEDLAPTIEGLTANSTIPRLLAQGSAFIKHNILVFDIFHGSRFAQMQAAFEARIPSFHKGLALLEYSDKDLAVAQKHGLISEKEAIWAKENRPKIEGLIQQGVNVGRISDAIYADAVPLMPGAKATNRFIFEKLSRGIITQSAVYALDRNAALHPEWTPKELNRYTAKEINTYYRNLGNQGVFKSKTFQDLSRALIFAPQWIEGLVRSEARGYGQLGKVVTTGNLGNIGKGMATGLVAYFAFAQLVNMLTRGKPTWKNPEPGHKLDAWIPDVAQGSNGFFVSPLSVFAETTHDALKYTERGMEPLDVTTQLVTNKLHPDVRAMRDLFGGKDFYGRPLHGWERVTQALSDIAPIPMFARTGGYRGGAERQILSTLGIKATPAPSSSGDVYQLAADFKRQKGIKTDDTYRESDYAKLRKALSNNDLDAAQSEYDALKTSKGQKKVAEYFQDFTKRPFTGSLAMEKKFRATLDRGQTDLYTSALREREEIVKRYRALRK